MSLPTKNRVKQLLEKGVEKSESHTERKQLGVGCEHTLPHLAVPLERIAATEKKQERYIC